MGWDSRRAGSYQVHRHQLLVLVVRRCSSLRWRMLVVVVVVGLPLPHQRCRKGPQKGCVGRRPCLGRTVAQAGRSHGGCVVAPHRVRSTPDWAASNQSTCLGTCRCQAHL